MEILFKKSATTTLEEGGGNKIDSGAVIINYLKCPIIENLATPTSSVAKVANTTTNLLQLLPLELGGSRIHIVMKSDKEIVGILLGFDDF